MLVPGIRQILLYCLVVLALTGLPAGHASATHIVGGGITYKCLGSTSTGTNYRIYIEIYQDCLNGILEARLEDIPAYVAIYDNNGLPLVRDSIGNFDGGSVDSILVPANFNNACVNNPPQLCLKKLTFSKTYNLPFNTRGYRVMYIRCCRNEAILNINSPGQVGATYAARIPATAEATCNNSAYFKNYPPQIICINNPLVYDHSAKDDDGDSLSYELCDAYPGGTTTQPKPMPLGVMPPPLSVINNNPPSYGYVQGFSAAKPMGGNPLIQINPVTGVITGTPNLQGRFVVAVCAHEWRKGVKINTVQREFQFTVTNCSKAVVADIPQFSEEYNTYLVSCKSKTVKFLNKSSGAFSYDWSFGTGATSNEFEPTYTYPDTGTYTVQLIVNKGSTCPDSISRFVKVYPDYSADYEFDGLGCPNADMVFTDKSEATYKPVVKWEWNFGDGQSSEVQNPTHAYAYGGDYQVRLISTSIKGCKDTSTKTVSIERFRPFAGNDTIIVKGESIDFAATGGSIFEWTPSTYLNARSVFNPRGYYPDTGRIGYQVYIRSPRGCEGYDSINVWVVSQPSLFIPSAFTPNGDGRNDLLRPTSVGYRAYKYFRVFNRFGEMVYETKRIGDGWDGTYKGTRADIGTYFWLLSAEDKDGATHQKKGDATLIR